MTSIDERIVSMKFENSKFMTGVQTTLKGIQLLKKGLDFANARRSMAELEKAGGRFNMGGMGVAIEGVSAKFLALSTIGVTALATITNKAIEAGTQFAKSFTFGPVNDGLHEYETNLKSIQVIQANTDQPLAKIEKSLQDLNTYADLTIYNFGQMARNIGTFTAAGVGLKDATSAIKGIANMAALSGSSSEQASGAMYQLSQAIAAGKVNAQDWNSVVNAGMAGKKLQNALAQTAVAMGKIDEAMISGTKSGEALKISGESFKNSIMSKPGEESWLTSDVLVNTLATLDGRFSKAALSAEKLEDGTLKYKNAAEITAAIEKSRNELAKKGVKFTEEQFKALGKLSDNAFKSATEVKTLGQVFEVARENIGSGWAGSFNSIFGNLKEAKTTFTALSDAIGGVIDRNARARNEMLASWKKMNGRTVLINGIRQAWRALESVLKPLREAFRDIFPAKTAKDLFAMTVAFHKFAANAKVSEATAEKLHRVFKGIFALFSIGKSIVKGIFSAFGSLFGEVGKASGGILDFAGGIADFLVSLDEAIKKGDGFTKFFQGLGKVLSVPVQLLSGFTEAMSNLFGSFDTKILHDIVNGFGSIGDAIKDGLGSPTTSNLIAAAIPALLGGIVLALRKFVKDGFKLDLTGGAFGAIKESFESLTGSLTQMQRTLQSKTLMNIAKAIALMAVSMIALSFVKAKNLSKSLAAMTVGFTQLLAAMAVMVKLSGQGAFLRIPVIAASLVLLAGAMTLLSVAVLAFSLMSWSQLAKGMAAIAVALQAIALGMRMMPDDMKEQAIAVVAVSGALVLLAAAVAVLGNMSLESLGKGLGAVVVGLSGIALAMRLMPKKMLVQAVALVAIAGALNLMAAAILLLGTSKWESIGKSLVALGGGLAILAVALKLMKGSTLAAASLFVVANALVPLTASLIALSALSWKAIGRGIGALAAALAVLGVAGLLLAPVVPALIGLGVAVALISAGFFLAAGALLLFTTALTAAAALGTAAVGSIVLLAQSFMMLIPTFFAKVAEGVVAFVVGLVKAAPQLLAAFTGLFLTLLKAVVTVAPKIGEAFLKLLRVGLGVLVSAIPQFVTAGFKIIMGFLKGLRDNIGKIIKVTAEIITRFLLGLAAKIGQIVDAGFKLIIAFIEGLTKAINKNAKKLREAGLDLAKAIINGMTGGLLDWGIKKVKDAAKKVAGAIPGPIKKLLGINSPSRVTYSFGKFVAEGLALGIEDTTGRVTKASGIMAAGTVKNVQATMTQLSNAFALEVDSAPVIAPVLDLTNIRATAPQIGSLIGAAAVTASVSTNQANSIAQDQNEVAEMALVASETTAPNITYEQNNYSPKALSPGEIYRNTRSQLALFKEELDDDN